MNRSFLAAAAVLLLAPIGAAEQPTTADQPLLLEGTTCATATATVPAPAAPALEGEAEPLWLNHCNAAQNCSDGSVVSCQGHTSCTVQADSVTCDGVTTQCAQCNVPAGCRDPGAYCACLQTSGPFLCRSEHCMMCPFPITPDCT